MPKKNIPAYSTATDTHYESWDALIEAEADGYLVIVVATYPYGHKKAGEVAFANTFAHGLSQKQCRAKAAYTRTKWNGEGHRQYNYKFFVRPNWKAGRDYR